MRNFKWFKGMIMVWDKHNLRGQIMQDGFLWDFDRMDCFMEEHEIKAGIEVKFIKNHAISSQRVAKRVTPLVETNGNEILR